jgi:hypothetical protein
MKKSLSIKKKEEDSHSVDNNIEKLYCMIRMFYASVDDYYLV